MGVGVIYRGPTKDKPGDPIPLLYHDYTAETYIIISGSGLQPGVSSRIENQALAFQT
jgi:hypothetical protein